MGEGQDNVYPYKKGNRFSHAGAVGSYNHFGDSFDVGTRGFSHAEGWITHFHPWEHLECYPISKQEHKIKSHKMDSLVAMSTTVGVILLHYFKNICN